METPTAPTAWDQVLLAVVGGVILYALTLVLAGLFLGDTVFDQLGFGPDDGAISDAAPRQYLRLVYGILGAVIVRWMTTLAFIIVFPLRRRERWAWWAVVGGVAVWFVLDTGLSVALGYGGHAFFNIGFAVALSIPLAAISRTLPSPSQALNQQPAACALCNTPPQYGNFQGQQ